MTIHPAFDPPPCGCDDPLCAVLPSVEEVVDTALQLAVPACETENLPLAQATGRILAAPARSLAEMPPFASVAMDGFALRLSDLTGPLPVAGTVLAGSGPCRLKPGTALGVMTGAMMPEGADTVIPSEQARLRGGCLLPAPGAVAGLHVRAAGSDLRQGEIVVAAGRRIAAAEAGALAAAGHGRVAVRRRIEVAFWTTGTELVEPGLTLPPGRIWDANRAALRVLLAQPWVLARDRGALADDPVQLRRAFARAARSADLIVTTGGVAGGSADHLRTAFEAAGGEVLVAGVALKPGKPLVLGRLGPAVWLGLPGNPLAVQAGWRLVGVPVLQKLAGLAAPVPDSFLVRLSQAIRHKPGRTEARPAVITGRDARGCPEAMCLDTSGSHCAGQLAQAQGFVIIPREEDGLPAGALVEFLPM